MEKISGGENPNIMEQGAQRAKEDSFLTQAKNFAENYKSEIGLAILALYVITLAIATIIEILEH